MKTLFNSFILSHFIVKYVYSEGLSPNLSLSALSTLTTTQGPKVILPKGQFSICLPGYNLEGLYCVKEVRQNPDITCVEGVALNGRCEISVDYTLSCPEGYQLTNKQCSKLVRTGVQFYCPKGYYDDGNACTTTVSSEAVQFCEIGQLINDSCVIQERAEKIITSKCPDGSELINGSCWKQIETFNCTKSNDTQTLKVINPKIEQVSILKKPTNKLKNNNRNLQNINDLPIVKNNEILSELDEGVEKLIDNSVEQLVVEQFDADDIVDDLEDILEDRRDNLRNRVFDNEVAIVRRYFQNIKNNLDELTDTEDVKLLKDRINNLVSGDLADELRERIDELTDSDLIKRIKDRLESLSDFEPEGFIVEKVPEFSSLPVSDDSRALRGLQSNNDLFQDTSERNLIGNKPKPTPVSTHEMVAVGAPQPKIVDVVSQTCGTKVQVEAIGLISCPPNFVMSENHCIKETRLPPKLSCGSNGVNDDGSCIPLQKHVPKQPGCPPHGIFIKGQCWKKEILEPIKTCPIDFHPADDVCLGFVPQGSLECPTGLSLVGDVCVGQIIREPTFLSLSE